MPSVNLRMRLRALGLLGVLLAAVGTYADSPQVVHLGYATYEGTLNSTANISNFLGIRYAAPPVGKSVYAMLGLVALNTVSPLVVVSGSLRFQGPQPPVFQAGVQSANAQPQECPQAGGGTLSSNPFRGLARRQSSSQIEDCLFLKHVCLFNHCPTL